jgi:hypothetical protein
MLKRPGDGALRSRKDATDVVVIEIAYGRRRLELAMKAVVDAQKLCAPFGVTVQESKELLRQLDACGQRSGTCRRLLHFEPIFSALAALEIPTAPTITNVAPTVGSRYGLLRRKALRNWF